MSLKYPSYFKEKEDLNGQKEVILILDCNNCPKKEETNFFKSKTCIKCFLKTLFDNRNQKFDYISILYNDLLLNNEQFELFLDYFKLLKRIKRIQSKIEKIRNQKCRYQEFKCRVFPNISSLYKINDLESLDPTIIYKIYINGFSNLNKENLTDSICQECYKTIRNLIDYILEILNDLRIIQKLKNFKIDIKPYKNQITFYEYLFLKCSLLINDAQEIQVANSENVNQLLYSYNLGKYNIFKVLIFEKKFEIEKNYRVEFFFKGGNQEDYFEKIIEEVCKNAEIIELDQIVPLEKLIEVYERESLKILNSRYKFSNSIPQKIGFITAIKKLNLEKLFPLLIDDFIEEIFLDSPKDEIYINHQKFGRCRTKIKFNSKELERIKALVRLYSGQRLDFKNPIIKFVIKNKYFNCRLSIDVEPVQINNFALDIRKLNRNIFTIQDLLKNETIDPLIAAFLYFNILRRSNITITGETDTGKTTLINALDLLTPKEFRKIYVENITESLNQIQFGKHQLKYRADSLEESILERYSKTNQIKTLLHRTPDIIYLGEILTKEESEAMFQCLAAGLTGFQTIHSKNMDSLMNRFLFHFKINRSCLNDLDLIILMKKKYKERKVAGIFEINKNESENKLFSSIFEYSPETNKWILTKSLYETNIVEDMKKYENIPKETFSSLIDLYHEIFEFLLKSDKIETLQIIEFFHKISYYSTISLDLLKRFWNFWKKNRSLNR